MSWNEFPFIAIPACLLWLAAGLLACRRAQTRRTVWLVDALAIGGIVLFALFIGSFWNALSRPPLRTMGETRLWYALFLTLVGYVTYRRWHYPWLLLLSAVAATAFTAINILKPEIHSIALMPALQSFLFIPHVIIYIIAYALFGVATLAAAALLVQRRKNAVNQELFAFVDNLVYIGFGFLALGLLLGAFWAKEAWGHYWTWDPKETLAFITGAAYLAYIHLRLQGRQDSLVIWALPIAFALLLLSWFGTTLFPGSSLHLYS
ncbi:MAG: cytochrome c biogenesis protein CcsA [Azoarcus sp.]|jgi:ABC-type transport system involved in cytochrome c biogenesis permease subunit|nr:cytochrome c biogenesis protein CcsA [Azoarcus sp.]